MSEENETEESNNQTPSTIAQFFFDPKELYWSVIAVLVSISIFSVWTLRSSFGFTTTIILIPIYSAISLITIRFKFRKTHVVREDKHTIFTFRRNGVSWKSVVQALLGAAIPLLLVWFVLFNSVPDSKEPADFIMLIAMLIYIGIVPITPALSAIPRLNILKTTATARVDVENSKILDFELKINPMDGYWYEHREDPEFTDAIKEAILTYLNENGTENDSI